MEDEGTNITPCVSTYLDLPIWSENGGKYNYKLFDKRKDFSFEVREDSQIDIL